jgi:hypothetical protein
VPRVHVLLARGHPPVEMHTNADYQRYISAAQ